MYGSIVSSALLAVHGQEVPERWHSWLALSAHDGDTGLRCAGYKSHVCGQPVCPWSRIASQHPCAMLVIQAAPRGLAAVIRLSRCLSFGQGLRVWRLLRKMGCSSRWQVAGRMHSLLFCFVCKAQGGMLSLWGGWVWRTRLEGNRGWLAGCGSRLLSTAPGRSGLWGPGWSAVMYDTSQV
jgi:hypothetical protein